jgi:uncharacterized protein YegL
MAGKGIRTHIAVLLDRSGSMQAIRDDALGSYNAYLEEQQKETADEALWSLTLFGGSDVIQRHVAQPVAAVTPLAPSDYVPSGGTPLYDAMGLTMVELEARVGKGDRALFVVITDGHENASVEWSHSAVEAKVEELTARGNWTIVYLASTADAVEIGRDLGVAQGNALAFAPGTEAGTMASLSRATSMYRRATAPRSDAFAQQVGRGASTSEDDA